MRGSYLALLLSAMACLMLIDWRWRLAYFYKRRQTVGVICISLLIFVLWDALGIATKIFFIGSSRALVGVRIHQFPLEELFFLILLNYNSLLLYIICKRRLSS